MGKLMQRIKDEFQMCPECKARFDEFVKNKINSKQNILMSDFTDIENIICKNIDELETFYNSTFKQFQVSSNQMLVRNGIKWIEQYIQTINTNIERFSKMLQDNKDIANKDVFSELFGRMSSHIERFSNLWFLILSKVEELKKEIVVTLGRKTETCQVCG